MSSEIKICEPLENVVFLFPLIFFLFLVLPFRFFFILFFIVKAFYLFKHAEREAALEALEDAGISNPSDQEIKDRIKVEKLNVLREIVLFCFLRQFCEIYHQIRNQIRK